MVLLLQVDANGFRKRTGPVQALMDDTHASRHGTRASALARHTGLAHAKRTPYARFIDKRLLGSVLVHYVTEYQRASL